MAWTFNPFSGTFDQKGSGGGGSAFFAGEVATYADLPLDGTAALNSRWLVRSNSGTWPFSSYKQAGIYIRTATAGVSRDSDYTLTDTSFHDVMSDDAFLIFDNADPTKAAKFDVGAQVGASQTRVITVPNKNITLDDAGDTRDPNAHSHTAYGEIQGAITEDPSTAFSDLISGLTVDALDQTGSVAGVLGGGQGVLFSVSDFAASGSITTSGLTQSTARILGRTTASTGAIEEIQIGSGLSLSAGELSSTVSAGIPATLLDAKGDLIVASAADTAARLPVGATNGHVLTVDSAEATGMKWAAAAGGVGGGTGSTDNSILRSDGTGGSTLQDSALVIDDATTSTQANVALRNNHSETNSSLVWTGKGTGALIWGPKPDGTSTGGNARGSRAVDLQPTRDSAGRIASGTNSFAIGHSNLASGTRSFAGGTSCTASGESTFAFGDNSSCSGSYGGIACGDNSSTTGFSSASFGLGNTASGNYSIAAGGRNVSSGANGSIALGAGATAAANGQISFSSGRPSTQAAGGICQLTVFTLYGNTTTNAAVELFGGMDNAGSVRFSVPSGHIITGLIFITGARTNGTGGFASYCRQFSIKNVGGTTSLVGTVNLVGTDEAAGTSISITANDTNDALKVECTGVASENWKWIAAIQCAQRTYAI